MSAQPLDELAARREAKAQAERDRALTPLEAMDEAAGLTLDLLHLTQGELLVDAQVVHAAVRRLDALVMGLRKYEFERGAR